MMNDVREKLSRLDEAISKDPGNAKLYGQRCTAYIDLQDYSRALDDARKLVTLLPDAPIGYLKAARCYRLTKRWKAAQKMLDKAAERGDEQTIKAIRTETRKLQADAGRVETSLFERLPTDIFVHIVSFLSQADLIRTTHVCQRWRAVLTAQPLLWQSLDLRLHHTTRYTSGGLPTQLHVWLQRLTGASLIRFTSRTSNATTTPTAAIEAGFKATLDCLVGGSHLRSLRALRTVGLRIPHAVLQNIATESSHTLSDFEWDLPDRHANMEPSTLLLSFPNLRILRLGFRMIPSLYRQSTRAAGDCSVNLRHLSMLLTRDVIDEDAEDPNFGRYRNLETLSLEAAAPEIHTFRVPYTLHSLAYLCLGAVNLEVDAEAGALFPNLQHLEFLPRCALATKRLLLSGIHSRSLRSLVMNTSFHGIEANVWLDFCNRHPDLEELRVSQMHVPCLKEALEQFPRLRTLQASSLDLPAKFLDILIAALPRLESLDISKSSNITSGPLLRLIKAREGRIQTLNICGCHDLQKEAVKWIKVNVKSVQWSGWGDKSESRAWNFR